MIRGLGAFTALLVVVWLAVFFWARTPGFQPMTADERASVMRLLRAGADNHMVPRRLRLDRPLAGALIVTLYDRGAPLARVESRRPTLGDAAFEAAELLKRDLDAKGISREVRARARIKVDAIRARAPIVTSIEPLFALSLEPGVDGIGLDFGGRELLLTADDLMRGDLLASRQPTRAMEFELGADTAALVRRFASEAGATGAAWRATGKRFFRFRAEQLVEPASPDERGGAPLEVVRGNPLRAPATLEPTRERLRAAALAGGRYLLRHLDREGRFDYEYYTLNDVEVGGYSLPRHGGGAYFLAQLYGATHDPAFSDGALRALTFLRRQVPAGCDRPAPSPSEARACVGAPDDTQIEIGSSALALTAAVEYARATGDHQFDAWARRLGNFIRFMQKPDGDFCHLYRPSTGERDEKTRLLYFSGEAAFALARLGDPADAEALDRALEYLAITQYDFFAGQFFLGEDHWTCLAADAGWDALPDAHRRRYARFCGDFAAFLRRTQFGPGDGVTAGQPDFAGAYGFSPLLPPHATPVGSRSEAMISAYALERRLGAGADETRAQIAAGMRFLLAHQLDDDAAWLMPNPEAARGGFLMSDVKRYIRIDFVQHSCSAMLRAAEIL